MTQILTEKVKSQKLALERSKGSKVKVEAMCVPGDKPQIYWLDRAFCVSYWTEAGLEKESLIEEVMNFLLLYKYFFAVDGGWSDWDLEIYRGIWSRAEVKLCTENHGGSQRLLRVQCAMRMSQFATMVLAGYFLLIIVALILGMPKVAAIALVVCTLNAVTIFYQNCRFGWILYQVLKRAAKKLYLVPINTKNNANQYDAR